MDGETRQLIDFDGTEVVRRKVIALNGQPPQYELVVSGTKPRGEMEVELAPQNVEPFVEPGYSGIAVIGVSRGSAPQGPAPYRVSMPLAGIAGSRGVVVIGATRSEKLDVPPGEGPVGVCRDWMAMRGHDPGRTPLLYVAGKCVFPRSGYSVELKRHEPQDTSAGSLLLDRVVREPEGPVVGETAVVDAVYRDSTGVEHGTVTILPEGDQIPVEDVDWLAFLDKLMRRPLQA